MKHYAPMADDVMCCLEDAGMLPSGRDYYLASEVDARIAELEAQMKAVHEALDATARLLPEQRISRLREAVFQALSL